MLHVTSVGREAVRLTSPITIQTATREEKRADLYRCFGSSKAYQERPQACQKICRSAGPRDGGVPGNCFGRKGRIDSGERIWSFCFVRILSNPFKFNCVPYSILAGCC